MVCVGGGRRVAIQNNPSVCCGILINEKTVALKEIAAILIMLGHCLNALNMDGKYSFLNVGWYCVALFFFLSGYGIMQGYMKKKTTCKNF